MTAFVKNAGLGFAIPYLHNGQPHDYIPDFIALLAADPVIHLILETKGYDPLEEVKKERRSGGRAVNADGTFGRWEYRVVRKVGEISGVIDDLLRP